MSKTYADQVTKAQMLVAGLKKNYESIKTRGISMEQIKALEAAANEAFAMNKEVETLREEVSIKAAKANKKLTEIKNCMFNAKQIIKRCFDQEKWIDYGVMDKR